MMNTLILHSGHKSSPGNDAICTWDCSFAAAIVGDITPCDGVSKEEKCKLETEAMEQIRSTIGYNTLPGKHDKS